MIVVLQRWYNRRMSRYPRYDLTYDDDVGKSIKVNETNKNFALQLKNVEIYLIR